MKKLSLFKGWKKLKCNIFYNDEILPHSDELSLDDSGKSLVLQESTFTFAQIVTTDYAYNSLSCFIEAASLQDIQWLFTQKKLQALDMKEFVRRSPCIYGLVLTRLIVDIYHQDEGKKKVDFLISWRGAKEVFASSMVNDWANPLYPLLRTRHYYRSLVSLLESHAHHIDMNMATHGDRRSFFETMMVSYASPLLEQALAHCEIRGADYGREGVNDLQREEAFYKAFSDALDYKGVIFKDRQARQEFICSKLYDSRQFQQFEAKRLFDALDNTRSDYLQDYLHYPHKLAELIQRNPDVFLFKELFIRYCHRASYHSIITLYRQLTNGVLGFFYKRHLEKDYLFYSLEKCLGINDLKDTKVKI